MNLIHFVYMNTIYDKIEFIYFNMNIIRIHWAYIWAASIENVPISSIIIETCYVNFLVGQTIFIFLLTLLVYVQNLNTFSSLKIG